MKTIREWIAIPFLFIGMIFIIITEMIYGVAISVSTNESGELAKPKSIADGDKIP